MFLSDMKVMSIYISIDILNLIFTEILNFIDKTFKKYNENVF